MLSLEGTEELHAGQSTIDDSAKALIGDQGRPDGTF